MNSNWTWDGRSEEIWSPIRKRALLRAAPSIERESDQCSQTGTRIGLFSRRSARCGDANELGDGCEDPGKSCLFFLTDSHPGLRLAGNSVRVSGKAAHFLRYPVRSQRPLKLRGRRVMIVSGRTDNRIRSPRLAASGR